jgi:hypothetical protein
MLQQAKMLFDRNVAMAAPRIPILGIKNILKRIFPNKDTAEISRFKRVLFASKIL